MRQQRLGIGEHFEFYHVADTKLASQACRAQGVFGGETSRSVWQQLVLRTDPIKQTLAGTPIVQIRTTNRHRHHIAAGFLQRHLHRRHVGIFAGADQQATLEGVLPDFQRRDRRRQDSGQRSGGVGHGWACRR